MGRGGGGRGGSAGVGSGEVRGIGGSRERESRVGGRRRKDYLKNEHVALELDCCLYPFTVECIEYNNRSHTTSLTKLYITCVMA